MRYHDAQRKAEAAEQARLKAETTARRDARIIAMWREGELSLAEIGSAVGVSGNSVARVLDVAGLRPKQSKRGTKRRSIGAIIQKVRGHDEA